MINVDIVKLVPEDCYASNEQVEDVIELAVEQATLSWGVRQQDRIILAMANRLYEAQRADSELDSTQRALKGQQLQCGRLAKRAENAEAAVAALESANHALTEEISSAKIAILTEEAEKTDELPTDTES